MTPPPIDQSLGVFDLGKLPRIMFCIFGELCKTHPECGQGLARTVVQLTRNVSAFLVLN